VGNRGIPQKVQLHPGVGKEKRAKRTLNPIDQQQKQNAGSTQGRRTYIGRKDQRKTIRRTATSSSWWRRARRVTKKEEEKSHTVSPFRWRDDRLLRNPDCKP